MTTYKFKYAGYKLRDYEKKLALLELRMATSATSFKRKGNYLEACLNGKISVDKLEGLTFFSEILINNKTSASVVIPIQVKYELSAKLLKKETCNKEDYSEFLTNGLQTARQLRYLTHLMHEYKGRYSPQLCKSLINLANIEKGATVLDPFVGSGTTLVECLLNGFSGIGVDLNPMSYLITKTKIESFSLRPEALKPILNHFVERLRNRYESIMRGDIETIIKSNTYDSIVLNYDYLASWFPLNNLKQIFFILSEIKQINDERIRHFLLVALSDILRNVSFQDPGQLRIKRRKLEDVEENVIEIYLQRVNSYYRIIEAYQFVKPPVASERIVNYLADTRNLRKEINIEEEGVDAIVTSPPYATALPYIDTDRLSLFLFGYVNKQKYKELEEEMIGNREITKKEKQILEEDFLKNYKKTDLPHNIKKIIKKIHDLNETHNVGFRRKNTAALLYKYFKDMSLSMMEMCSVLKKNSYCFMVVGCNNTKAGNKNVFIPTDDYIGKIGQMVGFKLKNKISLTVPPSYMIHKNNAIKRESVLVFQKP